MSSLSEADTRAKLIDAAIHAGGWAEKLIGSRITSDTVHGARVDAATAEVVSRA